MPELIRCYQNVFADPPWNEHKRCGVCGKYWGRLEHLRSNIAEHCGKPVVDFWSADVVESNICSEVGHEASCWVARLNGEIVGFCWGYPLGLEVLDQKLQLAGVSGAVRSHFGNLERVAFQNEVGVVEELRGQKIAKKFFQHRLNDFLEGGLTVGVVRTRRSPEPSVTYLWFTQKLGYTEVAAYPGDDGRVILARSLHGLCELL